SFGIGQAPDAADFGDEGADTLGHIVDYFTNNGMSISLPNLSKSKIKKLLSYSLIHLVLVKLLMQPILAMKVLIL
ncbi:hypothetical protein IBE76_10190, partial [Francisella tularensis]|nr:hypothetical protein [Francisella tularensis]